MKLAQLDKAQLKYFDSVLRQIDESGRFSETRNYIQHGNTTVYSHCVAVAFLSLWLANFFNVRLSVRSLITGALLHDYFLYDWHEKDSSHRLHGFTHPKRALENALEDWSLDSTTQNTILRHMFPLTVIPPVCKEAWLVCLADKTCALAETFNLSDRFFSSLKYPYNLKNPCPGIGAI